MHDLLTTFIREESGVTAVEYAFIAGLVSIASVLAWDALGASLEAAFQSVTSDVESARRS